MSYNSFKKEHTKKQQTPKGCCCKRSQCIKNYCDCYQSMTTCSIYCKCIGCRNTEERIAVASPPKKSAMAAKRERAAALSAKAAAAAAKAGINIHLKPAPGSAAFVGQKFNGPAKQTINLPQQPQIFQLPDADLDNIITLPPPNVSLLSKKAPFQAALPAPQTPKNVNIIKQPTNVALLECILAQASEAEQLGMTELQVGQLVLHEFARGLQAIINTYNVE
ncbi:protein lin-54 homolog [Drosophila busckii]|uniref:protein lin-54 homolog n=1 Tax=Drosophila busckii TaxID=30019 RepID=UPI0014331E23|nr:protein lin-54 homolog [Drosophila busckii]